MSISDADKLAIIEGLYAATGAGDFKKAEEFLTDDFFVTEADTLPYAGVYRGKTALQELFTKVMSMMDVERLEIAEHTVGGDYGITILQLVFVDKNLAPAPLTELYRFRDSKVCEIRPYYFDTNLVIAACKAKGSI